MARRLYLLLLLFRASSRLNSLQTRDNKRLRRTNTRHVLLDTLLRPMPNEVSTRTHRPPRSPSHAQHERAACVRRALGLLRLDASGHRHASP